MLHDQYFVGSSGAPQHFVRTGNGPLVVLLHGWPGYWYDWRHVIRDLAEDFEVVAPDLRGFGRSNLPAGVHEHISGEVPLARDVADLIDDLGRGPAIVAGTDVGAAVAQRLARDHVKQIRGLVLLNPPHFGVPDDVRNSTVAGVEGWYQQLHQFEWAPKLVAGRSGR